MGFLLSGVTVWYIQTHIVILFFVIYFTCKYPVMMYYTLALHWKTDTFFFFLLWIKVILKGKALVWSGFNWLTPWEEWDKLKWHKKEKGKW